MDKSHVPSINLAKNRGQHLSDRILTFALTIGRVLVIVTEAIALGAFLFRFGLDRQLVDLHDRIQQEQAIVALLKSNEATYRNLQDRLTFAKTITTSEASSIKLYQDIFQMIPSDMSLITLSAATTTVHVEAEASSLLTLTAFVNKLRAYQAVQSVSLDKIENKSEQGIISAVLTINLKKDAINQVVQQTSRAQNTQAQ